MELTSALAYWLSVEDLEFLFLAWSKLDFEVFGNFLGMYSSLSGFERLCIRRLISGNFDQETMASALCLGIKILSRGQCQL